MENLKFEMPADAAGKTTSPSVFETSGVSNFVDPRLPIGASVTFPPLAEIQKTKDNTVLRQLETPYLDAEGKKRMQNVIVTKRKLAETDSEHIAEFSVSSLRRTDAYGCGSCDLTNITSRMKNDLERVEYVAGKTLVVTGYTDVQLNRWNEDTKSMDIIPGRLPVYSITE